MTSYASRDHATGQLTIWNENGLQMRFDEAEARDLRRQVTVLVPGPGTSFYDAFLAEMNKVTIIADASAVGVVGACTRAAKRAQMVVDGEPVSPGPWLIDRESSGAPALDRYVGNQQPEPEPDSGHPWYEGFRAALTENERLRAALTDIDEALRSEDEPGEHKNHCLIVAQTALKLGGPDGEPEGAGGD